MIHCLQEIGTFYWMAPELMSVGKCTEKADIFSFGVVLYEILTGERPIRGRMKAVKYVPLMLQCNC